MRRILELNFSVINHHLFQFYKVSFHQFKPQNKMKEKDFSVNQDNHLGKSYTLFKFQVTLDPLKNIMYMQRNSKKQRKHIQLTVGSVTASSTSNVLQSLGNMDEAGNSSLFTIYLRHELTQKEMIQMHHGKLCHQHWGSRTANYAAKKFINCNTPLTYLISQNSNLYRKHHILVDSLAHQQCCILG